MAPYVSSTVGRRLSDAGWSWADSLGNLDLRSSGLRLHQRMSSSPPKQRQRTLPGGSGGTAIIRALIGLHPDQSDEMGATALAAQAGVTQPRASQVLHQLLDLDLVDMRDGRWEPDRERLLDRFLAEYTGPKGSTSLCYSIDSPMDVAIRATTLQSGPSRLAVSADCGPDLIIGWQRPSVVIVYAERGIDIGRVDLVAAQGHHDANVIVRMPNDKSVYPNPQLVSQIKGVELQLADPTQMIWDLMDLGGEDRLEAAGELRRWLLNH